MPQLFGRRVTVTLGQAGAPGIALSGLRVNFRVEMSRSSVPHGATIRIWNPSPATVALLEAGPLPTVLLAVGYADPLDPTGLSAVPRLIFTGDVVRDGLTTRKEGVDRVVEIEAQDGGQAYQTTRVDLTFATPTTLSSVVAAVAAALALPVGLITVLPDVTLAQGGLFSGQGRDVLDRIAASVNHSWWISDGVFFFAPTATGLPLPAPVFSSALGNLVGAPKKKDRGGIEVRALLDASLRPGGTFLVEQLVEGVPVQQPYLASDVVFEGDSGFDTGFYVTATGTAMG